MSSRATPLGAALVSVAAAAVLAACGAEPAGQDTATTRDTAATPTSEAESSPAQTKSPADNAEQPAPPVAEELRFTATTLDGEKFSGESLAGKAAVLWFWAPWCPNCRAEAPSLASAAAENKGDVTFVGVASQDEAGAMRDFVRDYGVSGFTHLNDGSGELWQRFGVTYQPAYAFISPDGQVDVVKQQLPEGELAQRVGELAGA